MKILLIKTWLICTGIFLAFSGASGSPNGGSWQLESPRKDEVIKSGELLITVKLLDSVKVFKGSFQLFIDDYLISNFVKFTPDQISVLYTSPLSEGLHKLEMHVKSPDVGFLTPLASTFYVNKFSGLKKDSVIVRKADHFEFSGTVSGLYKVINTDGPGAQLAQTVPYVREFSADVVARIGQVSFPVKYFNTSDDQFYPPGFLPPRNYLEYGVRYKSVELLFGDHNPVFDRLVLSGIRITGYKFTLTGPRFQMQIIDGTAQPPHEGSLVRYVPSEGAPPPGLRPDSNYIIPGVYQRHLTAGRFSFGNRIEGSLVSINILRARDYLGSIAYGANPADNIVVGMDESFVTPGGNMKVNAGLATSLFTADRSTGPVTEEKIDSFYGYKVGFNPNSFKDFFTVNLSTVKPGEASSAGYLNSVFKSINKSKTTENLLTLDYRFFGPEYTSFGNPLVRNDMWAITGQDQIGILSRKIMFTGRYTYQGNNLAASEFSTLITQIIGGNILFAPAPNLPQLNIIVNDQLRNTPVSGLSNLVSVNDYSLNLTGALTYSIKLGDNITGFNVSYTKSTRVDAINTQSSNNIQIINGGITETFMKLNLSLDLHYANMTFSNDETPLTPLSNTYDGHIRYQIKKLKTTIGLGASLTQSLPTALTGSSSSTRSLFNATISSQIAKGLLFDLEGGMAPYTDLADSANNYRQNYGMVKLTYNFDFKR
ncbi:MAG: hypothetical protein ACHP6H_04160 [Legionellales bacterium]